MTPMFVDTINLSLSSDVSSLNVYNDISSANNYALRATQQQSLQFQATPDILGPIKTAYNWLTQSNVDTLKESLMSASLSDTQLTLLFNNVKKTIYLQTGESSYNSADQNIIRLRRRFSVFFSFDRLLGYVSYYLIISLLNEMNLTIIF